MMTIRFTGWISGRIVSLQRIQISKNYFQTGTGYGSGYPKRFCRYVEDSEFWKKLHIAQSFIYFSIIRTILHSVPWLQVCLWCNPIPPLLNGHAKFFQLSMNLYLVCQDRAFSVYKNVICCAGLPLWIFWSQILKFWVFWTPLAFFGNQKKPE